MYQMILFTGNEYLATGKKLLTKELILLLKKVKFLEKKSDVESDLCNQMRKVISFYIAF